MRKNNNLIPNDKINVSIRTKEDISKFIDMIKNTVNANNIDIIAEEGNSVSISSII
jgi:hypothetical protein